MARLFHIRRATIDDLADLVRLEKQCFSMPWSEESLTRDLRENTRAIYLAAVGEDSTLMGYAALWIVADEGQITNIAVEPASRRQGIARNLLIAVEELAKVRKLRMLLLEVRESNQAARRLYDGLNFRKIGERKNYYEKPTENAIILLKDIEQI